MSITKVVEASPKTYTLSLDERRKKQLKKLKRGYLLEVILRDRLTNSMSSLYTSRFLFGYHQFFVGINLSGSTALHTVSFLR